MVFIGYEPRRKAYKAYDPVTERVHISRDVIFDEQVQWDWAQGGGRGEDVDTNTFSAEMEYTTTVLGVPMAEKLVGALRPLSPVGSPSPPLQPRPPIPIVTVGNRARLVDMAHHQPFMMKILMRIMMKRLRFNFAISMTSSAWRHREYWHDECQWRSFMQ
jgi:hypothetical protein